MQRQKAGVGPASGPTRRLPHLRARGGLEADEPEAALGERAGLVDEHHGEAAEGLEEDPALDQDALARGDRLRAVLTSAAYLPGLEDCVAVAWGVR